MKFTDEEDFREDLESVNRVIFYGAGGMGRNLYLYLKRHEWERKLSFFVVTTKNMETFCGIPVRDVSSLDEVERKIQVVIATRRNFHEEIRRTLSDERVRNVHVLSEELLNKMERLANQFYRFDFETCRKRHEIWEQRKQRAWEIWSQARA